MDSFINRRFIYAVIGVSQDKSKWGYRVWHHLTGQGFRAAPLNPKYSFIDDYACYPDLASMPQKPHVVITVVPPQVTENIVLDCHQLGIKKIWMQPGSESDKALKYCQDHHLEVISGACIVRDGLKQAFVPQT